MSSHLFQTQKQTVAFITFPQTFAYKDRGTPIKVSSQKNVKKEARKRRSISSDRVRGQHTAKQQQGKHNGFIKAAATSAAAVFVVSSYRETDPRCSIGGFGGKRLPTSTEKMTSMAFVMVNNLPEWPNKCQSLALAPRRANF